MSSLKGNHDPKSRHLEEGPTRDFEGDRCRDSVRVPEFSRTMRKTKNYYCHGPLSGPLRSCRSSSVNFFLIFRREIWEIWWEFWREFCGIFSDPQNKGSNILGESSIAVEDVVENRGLYRVFVSRLLQLREAKPGGFQFHFFRERSRLCRGPFRDCSS